MIKLNLEVENLDWLLKTDSGKKALSKGLSAFALTLFNSVHRVIDEGESFTPRTGHLQQSIRVDLSNVHEGKTEIVADASYAPFVEFGTKPHVIRPKKRHSLRWATEEGYTFAKLVHHPGIKPYPFFRKAIEEYLSEAEESFTEAFLKALKGEI